MYAITNNSYRCIASESDLLPGEQAVSEVPAWLLDVIEGNEIRRQRDALLRACDWTQLPDVSISEERKQQWSDYRQALRDLPEQEGFPNVVFPTPPT